MDTNRHKDSSYFHDNEKIIRKNPLDVSDESSRSIPSTMLPISIPLGTVYWIMYLMLLHFHCNFLCIKYECSHWQNRLYTHVVLTLRRQPDIYRETKTDRWTGRQAGRCREKWRPWRTDRWTDRQTDGELKG